MSIYVHDDWDYEPLCDICQANTEIDQSLATMDIYIINNHCIEIKKSRQNRHNKNIKTLNTAF